MKNQIVSNTLIKNVFKPFSKFYLCISCLVFLSLGVFGSPHLASKQQIGMFKNSKTCVVLENNTSPYNLYIKSAVEKYWKSTEYEFIDQVQFNSRRYDSRYSFLVLMKGIYDNDPGGVSYNYISLVLGDPALDMTDMPEICSIPLCYSDAPLTDYQYVLPSIIKFMQKHAKNLEKNRFSIAVSGLKYYNKSAGFKDKVILLNKDMMAADSDTPEKINTVYPYYVKLLSASEILDELSTMQKNLLIHFHVGPGSVSGAGKCFEMIFDVDGNLYYYNYRMVTNDNKDGFNLNDFNHIN